MLSIAMFSSYVYLPKGNERCGQSRRTHHKILIGRVRHIQTEASMIQHASTICFVDLCGYPSFSIWTLPVLNFGISMEKLKLYRLSTPLKEKNTLGPPTSIKVNACLLSCRFSANLSIFTHAKSTPATPGSIPQHQKHTQGK